MELLYSGTSLQVELLYRWNHFTGDTTLQVKQLYRWNYFTGGSTLQLELLCRWIYLATLLSLTLNIHEFHELYQVA